MKMGTKAAIGLLNKDGSVRSATVAYDGMPDDAGEILREHYNTEALIQELLNRGGDLRTLGKNPNSCSFYRNSDYPDATEHDDREEWGTEHYWCDYKYLFDPAKGEWETVED